jgi:hypothetical protein
MAKSHGLVITQRHSLRPAAALRARSAASLTAFSAPAPANRRLARLTMPAALSAEHAALLRPAVRRTRVAMACACGGKAQRVRSTPEERARFGGDAFARAFICTDCGTRYVGRAKPFANWRQ